MLVRFSCLCLLTACSVGERRPPSGDAGPGDSGIHVRCDNAVDNDADTILDDFENAWGAPAGAGDWDGDTTPNAGDTDSDDDGISDRDEAGSGGCGGRNSDDDTIPDFLDNDSDNDGLSDREETTVYFTDPLDEDTDRDGFSDLAEAATGNDPNDPNSRIPPETFYVVLPYQGEAVERDLIFGTSVRKADVFFMLDGTGSMDGERSRLVSSLTTIVPQLAMSIRDVGVGFGGFAGFGGPAGGTCTIINVPLIGPQESCPDGQTGDEPFRLDQVITTNIAEMQAGVGRLHTDYGGANWASSNEALYLAATGEGFQPWLGPQNCVGIPDEVGRRRGYPCFRPGSLPIMVVMTDTSSKNGPHTGGVSGGTYDPSDYTMSVRGPHTYEEARAALNGIGARVIGILSGTEITNPTPRAQFDTWARDTGTVDASGTPIVFEIGSDGSGLDTRIIDAIRTLAEETPQDISTTSRDGEDFPARTEELDAREFIESITPVSLFDGAALSCPDPTRCDGERFFDVTPGLQVTFRVRFQNDFVPPIATSQVFRATIVVLGNGVAELDTRDVVIVVPAGSQLILI